jgi:alkanesulfonate monooxygenase SsuD/methylene tetrahydromethanopterin reductase-like flavin-dependent oxidoreductase (luciferase family)
VARFAQHWNYPGGPVDEFAAKLAVLRGHCEDLGRDPSEITVSTHLRGGTDDIVEQTKRYGDAGLDLGIVYLRPPHTPDVLDELAAALAPLRG